MRTWTEWVSLGQLPDSPCFSFLVLSAFQSRTWTLSQIAFKCPGPWHKTQAHRSGKFRDSRPNMTPENKHDFLAKRTCKICEPSFCLEVLEVLLGSSCWWRYFGVFEDHLEDPRNMFTGSTTSAIKRVEAGLVEWMASEQRLWPEVNEMRRR